MLFESNNYIIKDPTPFGVRIQCVLMFDKTVDFVSSKEGNVIIFLPEEDEVIVETTEQHLHDLLEYRSKRKLAKERRELLW